MGAHALLQNTDAHSIYIPKTVLKKQSRKESVARYCDICRIQDRLVYLRRKGYLTRMPLISESQTRESRIPESIAGYYSYHR